MSKGIDVRGNRAQLGSVRARKLSRTVSAIALMACLPGVAALAQTAEESKSDSGMQEVVVTGLRASEIKAQEIKQDAETFVDALTAQDIGALPDRSVVEAIQRLPGVAIDHFQGSNDPDHFSVEGNGLVVQGLNHVRSEFNGRDAFSVNNARSLSFADVPAEMMGSVVVSKSPSADMIEGGLSGTVNLITRLPFDSNGQVFAFSSDGNYSDFANKWSGAGSVLYSNRWDVRDAEIGLLASYSYSDLKNRSDGSQISTFTADTALVPGKTVYAPVGAGVRTDEFDHSRIGESLALQYKSNDNKYAATLQYLRSNSQETWQEKAIYTATDAYNNGGIASVPSYISAGTFTYDGNGIFNSGLVASDEDSWAGLPWNKGTEINFGSRSVLQKFVTEDTSANFKWRPTDQWRVDLDLQHVGATTYVRDFTTDLDAFGNTYINNTGGGIPTIQFKSPVAGVSDQAWYTNPNNYLWRDVMDHYEQDDGYENAAKLDATYVVHSDWIDSVKFGSRFSERDQTTRWTQYGNDWGNLSEVWSGGGPVTGVQTPPGTPGGMVPFAFSNFQNGSAPSPLPGAFFQPCDLTKEYAACLPYILKVRQQGGGSWTPANMRAGVLPGTAFLPGEVNHTIEDSVAAYAMLRFENPDVQVLGHTYDISGNVGVREIGTLFRAQGGLSVPYTNSLTLSPDPTTGVAPPLPQYCANLAAKGASTGNTKLPPVCSLSLGQYNDALGFANGALQSSSGTDRFYNTLPSFNLKVGIQPDMLVRFAAAKAMERNDLGLSRNYLIVSPLTDPTSGAWMTQNGKAAWSGQAGNPYLKPVTSKQFDLSWEWYYAKDSSVTLSVFDKIIDNVVIQDFQWRTVTNNGVSMPVYVQTPINASQTGTVKGMELAYRQFFTMLPEPFNGLGFQGSYTHLNSHGIPNAGTEDDELASVRGLSTNPNLKLPLEGLSDDNINLTGMYESGPHSLRVAWTWRSKYLLTERDAIFPWAPIYADAYGQLDASYFYSITDHIKMGIQVANITDSITKTLQVINPQGLQAFRSDFQNDRRYTFSVRGNF